LDPWDFASHDYVDNSGWPIGPDQLRSAYRRASELCGLGTHSFELGDWQHLLQGEPLPAGPDVVHRLYQIRKLRFHSHYRATLQASDNITLYLHSPVLRLHATGNNRRVGHVSIGSYRGNTTNLKAKQFVLASGGLENARLLLLSGSDPARALGNQNDCVGRYFVDHGFIDSGWFAPSLATRDMRYYFPVPHPHNPQQASMRPVITLAPEVLQREKLLNSAMFFYPAYASHPAYATDAVKAALELWEILKDKAAVELWQMLKTQTQHDDLWRFCKRMGGQPGAINQAIIRKLRDKSATVARWRLRFYYECVPEAGNRVVLGRQKDRFGRSQARLISRLSEQDLDSARRFHIHLNKLFKSTGVGQLTFYDDIAQWDARTESAKHPSGTTRMHDNPRRGVVDRNCKVHGLDNLYAAGSSVFPTVGYANPTLTIVALAVRLAEHLKQQGV
jgi:choline dehydrogenase-like flavoprotein